MEYCYIQRRSASNSLQLNIPRPSESNSRVGSRPTENERRILHVIRTHGLDPRLSAELPVELEDDELLLEVQAARPRLDPGDPVLALLVVLLAVLVLLAPEVNVRVLGGLVLVLPSGSAETGPSLKLII